MWLILFRRPTRASPRPRRRKGLKALDAGKPDAAGASLNKAIAADPLPTIAPTSTLGLAYSMSSKEALAIPEYKKTLGTSSGFV